MIITLTGADFSANNINDNKPNWYINASNELTVTLSDSSGGTGPYYYHKNSGYAGKTINAIRLIAPQANSIEYGKVVNGEYTAIGSITVIKANTFATYIIPEITLQSNEYIAFTGWFYFSTASTSPENTWFCDISGNQNKMNLGIDVGYIPNSSVTAPTSTTWYLEAVSGFDLNAACPANNQEKYYYQNNINYVNKPINAIKLYAENAGTFKYGIKIDSNYVELGTATASSVGEIIIMVPEFTIADDQLFWIKTETGSFKFGTTDPGNNKLYFNSSQGSINKMNLGISIGYVV